MNTFTTFSRGTPRRAPSAPQQPTRIATMTRSLIASSHDLGNTVKHSLDLILNPSVSSERDEFHELRSPESKMTTFESAPPRWAHPTNAQSVAPITVRAAERVTVEHASRPSTEKPTASSRKATRDQTKDEKRLARQCEFEGCANYIINRGRCFRHGGGKRCSVDGCNASAKIAGRCWKHGGSIKCIMVGCDRRGKSRGLCWAHGGGTKCHATDCDKVAVSNGFCWAHGGGKRCQYEGCKRPAYERTLNYCRVHFDRFERGEEVLEL